MQYTQVSLSRTIPLGGGEHMTVQLNAAVDEGDSPGAIAERLYMEVNANILPKLGAAALTPRGQVAQVASTGAGRALVSRFKQVEGVNGTPSKAPTSPSPEDAG